MTGSSKGVFDPRRLMVGRRNDRVVSRLARGRKFFEGATVARLFGRLYAFIARERIGGVLVSTIDDPLNPEVVQFINVRNVQATTSTIPPKTWDLKGR